MVVEEEQKGTVVCLRHTTPCRQARLANLLLYKQLREGCRDGPDPPAEEGSLVSEWSCDLTPLDHKLLAHRDCVLLTVELLVPSKRLTLGRCLTTV